MAEYVTELVDARGQSLLDANWGAQAGANGRVANRPPIGGVFNPLSGLGGPKDKGDKTFFEPTIFTDGYYLQTLDNESWAANNAISIPVDDMFIKDRQWNSDDEALVKVLKKAIVDYKTEIMLANVMKAGRLFGSAILVMVLDGTGELDEPLDVTRIREGDLRNLLVFDRYDVRIDRKYTDLRQPKYNEPEIYRIMPRNSEDETSSIYVHESRCLRFDGKRPLTTMGWQGPYDRDWGLSILIPAILEISHDAGTSGAIAHLTQEASIAIVKLQNFQEAISGKQRAGEKSLTEIATDISMHKSVFNMMFMDAEDDASRLGVNLAGFGDLLNRYSMRLASIFGISATRFLSTSPVGFFSTGSGEAMNYSLHVAAMQQNMLPQPLSILDDVLARSLGIKELPEYEWLSLAEFTDLDRAKLTNDKVKAMVALYKETLMEGNEVRERLSGDWLLGQLEPLPDEFFEEPEPAIPPQEPPPGDPDA